MITIEPAVYNRVVDSLDLRVNMTLPPSAEFQSFLPRWQKFIQESKKGGFDQDPLRQFIPNIGPFSVLSYTKRPYAYVISNPSICDVRIWNPANWHQASAGKTGQLYVNFRSQYLQYNGLEGALRIIESLKDFFYGPDWREIQDDSAFVRVSRIDLAADVSGPPLTWSVLDTFVSRARTTRIYAGNAKLAQAQWVLDSLPPLEDNKGGGTYKKNKSKNTQYKMSGEQLKILREAIEIVNGTSDTPELSSVVAGRQPQTIYFGTFGGAKYCRVYDKSASLDIQEKGYMREIWAANGWNGEDKVLRVEFSYSGDFLRKAGDVLVSQFSEETGEIRPDLRDFHLISQCLNSLWTYSTTDWIRQIEKNDADHNQWRGETTQFWQTVQSAFETSSTLVRMEVERNPKEDQLLAQLRGVTASLLAIQMDSNQDVEPQYQLLSGVADWFESHDFQQLLIDRRMDLGVDDETFDTIYSARVRKDVMAVGLGS